MTARALLLITLIAAPAAAMDLDLDRKSPDPLPEVQNCLRVQMTRFVRTAKCVEIDPAILRKYDLMPGGEVSAGDLIYLHDESEKLRRRKRR